MGRGGWRQRAVIGAIGAGVAVSGGALGVSMAAAGTSAPSVITGGQTLASGASLQSGDGRYTLSMQTDGDLVESIAGAHRVAWSSQTSGYPGATAEVQPDGSLVVSGTDGETLWSDNAPGSGGCAALNVLNDGQVEVDGPSGALWSSGAISTLQNGDELLPGQMVYSSNDEYELIMQGDGNLVLYNSSGTALWNIGTGGHPGAYAILQGDGNFVVYSASGPALWNTQTGGHSGDDLVVQSDGNVVIYPASGGFLWDSATDGAAPGSGTIAPQPQLGSSTPCPASVTTTAPATVTVTVPTTTVITLSSSASRTRRPKVKIPVVFSWTWRGAYSFLRRISFARVPANLHWSATVTPAGRNARVRGDEAATSSARRDLLHWLEHQRYRPGYTVRIELSRPGYISETVTFRIRLHQVPAVLSSPTARK